MSSLNERQKVIDSLTTNLPDLAESLIKLVNYLQKIIEDGTISKEGEYEFDTIFSDITQILEVLITIEQKTIFEKDDIISTRYKGSIKDIISGLRNLLNWMEDENLSEVKLKESVDQLFKGGQQIIQLVDMLTDN